MLIQLLKDCLADHSAIVVAPAGNQRVEQPYQVLLPCRLVPTDEVGELAVMTLDGVLTGLDERFEASSPAAVVLAGRVLADIGKRLLAGVLLYA